MFFSIFDIKYRKIFIKNRAKLTNSFIRIVNVYFISLSPTDIVSSISVTEIYSLFSLDGKNHIIATWNLCLIHRAENVRRLSSRVQLSFLLKADIIFFYRTTSLEDMPLFFGSCFFWPNGNHRVMLIGLSKKKKKPYIKR